MGQCNEVDGISMDKLNMAHFRMDIKGVIGKEIE